MKASGLSLALAIAIAATASAQADVLLLDAITTAPANSESGVLRPRSGASMTQVQDKFGPPTTVMDAIGDPPITRWVYPGYTVYFEYQNVINVVVHR
jgi:hypothetical protein